MPLGPSYRIRLAARDVNPREWRKLDGPSRPTIPQHLITVPTVAGEGVGPEAAGCHCQHAAATPSLSDNPLPCAAPSVEKDCQCLVNHP